MEEQTAEAVGLPATVLSELEEGLLPDGLEEEVYVRVRNHIVTKWREDVTRWLSEEEAGSCLAAALQPVARFAWRMLLTHGAINVGVAPDILRRGTAAPDTQGSVIVIGAGLAGLAAARQLRMLGYKVVVLEGRDRAGGRVYSKALRWQPPGPDSGERSAEEEVVAMADLGGSVITGIDGNPLALLARQLQLPLHNIRQECPLYEAASGKPVDDDLDKEAQIAFNAALDRCSRLKDQLSQKAADSLSLGVALRTVVAAARDTADGNGGTGGGDGGKEEMMDALIEWHIANLEFANAAEVCSVSLSQWDQDDPWEHKGPHVFIPGGNGQLVQALTWGLPIFYNTVVRSIQYHADGVRVLTDDTCFSADAALVTVPLGVLKRRVLDFQPPLPQRKQAAIERLGFGLLNKVVLLFPYTFWDSQADMFGRVVPAPGLRGEAAEEFEKLSAGDAVERAVAALKAVFAPAGVTVPPPLQGEDYSILAESVMDRLFFAGEATTAQYPATMHGAFHSGLREAAKISLALARPRRERARALEEAGRKREPLRASAADLEAVERLLLVSRLLTRAFGSQDHLPDLAFGCISALLPPEELVAPDGALARLALVRIGIGSIKAGPRLPLDALYTVLPIEQLRTLMDVEGGDVARITFLVNDLNCRLLGRNALCSQTSQLLRLILMGRGEPVPEALEVIAASGDGKDEQEAAVEDSSWMSGTGTACGRVVAE